VSKKSERELIDQVERRLAEKFAEVPAGRISVAVDDAVSRFENSVIRDFIPLLVERRAAEELARLTAERRELAFA
jgi:hypothetical protein